jgi:hypothetical protein
MRYQIVSNLLSSRYWPFRQSAQSQNLMDGSRWIFGLLTSISFFYFPWLLFCTPSVLRGGGGDMCARRSYTHWRPEPTYPRYHQRNTYLFGKQNTTQERRMPRQTIHHFTQFKKVFKINFYTKF